MSIQNPILVNVIRNNVVESFHRGSVIVVNSKGETVFSLGNIDRDIYPRSALKPLQAIPIVESGAADKFNLSAKEISLSCASHNSESIHVDTVNKWLKRLDLKSTHLECGSALPSYTKAAYQMIAAGETATKSHHNCSGKHSGMLTLASHLLDNVNGYSEHSHIVQQVWMNTLSDMIGEDVTAMHWEQDGCGLPAICMPIQKLAYAFSLFSEPDKQPGARGLAMRTILESIAKHPEMIGGSERCCSAVARETKGRVIAKYGAESVYAGVIPHLNLGFALKIDDGTARGSEVALGALLNKLNAISNDENDKLKDFFQPDILNSLDKKTGEITASDVWQTSPGV